MSFLRWPITSLIGALLVVLSCPGLGAAQDCSYNGAFVPALPTGGLGCVASGAIRSRGTVEIPAGTPLEVKVSTSLRLRTFSGSPGSLIIDANALLVSGVSFPLPSSFVFIDADNGIFNNGTLALATSVDFVRLRAATGPIQLVGTGETGGTLLEGPTVKLDTPKGNIVLNDVFISAEISLDVTAKGSITISNSLVIVDGGAGICRFSAKGGIFGLHDPSNTFHCRIQTS